MADADSNIDDVADWLGGILASITFNLPGHDQNLGRDVAAAVAKGIRDRSVPDAKGPGGTPWAANEFRYAEYKKIRYAAYQAGLRTGQMLSIESLMGETRIAAEVVEMAYGIGAPPTRTATGVPLAPSDRKVTDREKAGSYEAGGREFYALDDALIDSVVMPLVSEAVNRVLG